MIEDTVRHIYSLLLEQRYKDLQEFTAGIRMDAEEIKYALTEYDCNLEQYPDVIELDVVKVTDSSPTEWSVVAPIYTV